MTCLYVNESKGLAYRYAGITLEYPTHPNPNPSPNPNPNSNPNPNPNSNPNPYPNPISNPNPNLNPKAKKRKLLYWRNGLNKNRVGR